MTLIGLLLIALMGDNDWRTRETGTEWFDWCYKQELLPYEIEKAAFCHKDLEISHRARNVLRNYYVADEHGNIDITYREFTCKNDPQDPSLTRFVEKKEKEGWRLYVYWAFDGGTWKYRFKRGK